MINYLIDIMSGLPGSGKTTFCEKLIEEDNQHRHNVKKTILISIDDYIYEKIDMETIILKNLYASHVEYHKRYGIKDRTLRIIIDGLITKKEDLQTIVTTITKYLVDNCDVEFETNFTVHLWDCDRESCITNDRIRVKHGERDLSSEISIRNMTFDIDEKYIKYLKCKVEKHEVYKMSSYDTIIKPFSNKYDEEGVLESDSWSDGGFWFNYKGERGDIEPDIRPEFTELDDMLTQICPNITFLQYKKLFKECVNVEKFTEYDYYGGNEQREKWTCDLKKLHKMLVDMNLLENE